MGSSFLFLSFPLDSTTPAYRNGPGVTIEPVNRISKGDSCNTLHYSMPNHIGTHLDAPRHFDRRGLTIDSYPPEFWISKRITCLDISPVDENTVILLDDTIIGTIPKDVEVLLIKTGYCAIRNDEKYWSSNPGLDPKLANKLRESLPSLRIIGVDLISISSFGDRKTGRECHISFLQDNRPILIVEDMDLCKVHQNTIFNRIVVSPLIIKEADGSPCTVIAEVEY